MSKKEDQPNTEPHIIHALEFRYLIYDESNKEFLVSPTNEILNFPSIQSCKNCIEYCLDHFKAMNCDLNNLKAIEVGLVNTGKIFDLNI